MVIVAGLGFVLIVGVVVTLLRRLGGDREDATGEWRPTDELFRDPLTGRSMRVWVDVGDGSRHVVPDDDRRSDP